jgi:hypothetical protein
MCWLAALELWALSNICRSSARRGCGTCTMVGCVIDRIALASTQLNDSLGLCPHLFGPICTAVQFNAGDVLRITTQAAALDWAAQNMVVRKWATTQGLALARRYSVARKVNSWQTCWTSCFKQRYYNQPYRLICACAYAAGWRTFANLVAGLGLSKRCCATLGLMRQTTLSAVQLLPSRIAQSTTGGCV